MPIRTATEADVPRIIEMGMRSIDSGPYKDEIKNPIVAAETAAKVMAGNGRILLAEEDGKTVGLFGFIIYDHFYTGRKTAIELMWYVEPEYRHGFTAIALLRAAQRVAKELGAEKMQCSAPTEEVGRAYEAVGYRKLEVAYQRSL